jgi:hypothetical protein
VWRCARYDWNTNAGKLEAAASASADFAFGGYVDYDGNPNRLVKQFGFDPFAEVRWMVVRGDGVLPALIKFRVDFH